MSEGAGKRIRQGSEKFVGRKFNWSFIIKVIYKLKVSLFLPMVLQGFWLCAEIDFQEKRNETRFKSDYFIVGYGPTPT